ncbi:hypothetical protein [Novosphingobium clariflavum]|uniref:DUF3553 domain-containing protein n=1 Tax=Novosphingobium clariflavum TaxID=2029884 RepID=A0ABV6SEA3_9SPHN|nr:hypothetical protein [Novosphingobium clariflavum]
MSAPGSAFYIGQPVVISVERWTPNGWRAGTETGVVLTPSVMRAHCRGFVEVWRDSGALPEIEAFPRASVTPA